MHRFVDITQSGGLPWYIRAVLVWPWNIKGENNGNRRWARARARVLIGFVNSMHWKEVESWRPKHCSPVHKRPCSLIKTSDRIKRDSLIAKGFIFEVTEAKRSREDGDNNQSICAARWTLDRVSRLNYLVAGKKGKYRMNYHVWTILFVAADLFIHGSKLSEFIQSDVPSK